MRTECASSPRPCIHAGRFYDAEPQALRRRIASLLDEAPPPPSSRPPIAILVPHAGYVYSGPVAAAVYRTVQGRVFDRVLILGPTHTSHFTGAALPETSAFLTPLGRVSVDCAAVRELAGDRLFTVSDDIHAQEHAIEVEIPFLQATLAGPFQLLPVSLGELSPENLNHLADILWDFMQARRSGGQRWLVVASSDTYHGYDREKCRENDEKLARIVSSLDVHRLIEESLRREVMACGWKAIVLAAMLARRAGARQASILDRRDSSQVAHVEGNIGGYVVGYLGASFQ